MAGPNTRFYLDKQQGKIAGVCAGIADYFGVDLTLVRVGWIASLLVLGPLTPLAYFAMAVAAPKRPREMAEQPPEEKKFWQKVRSNPRHSVRTVRARFREIDRRLADVEAYWTSPNKRLEREIESLR